MKTSKAKRPELKASLASIGFSLAVAGIFLALFHFAPKSSGAWLHFLERKFLDAQFIQLSRLAKPDPSVIIIDVNDAALSEMEPTLGRWPWPRRTMGEIVGYLKQAGAKVIGIDVIYAERSVSDPEGDLYFVQQVRQAGNVVLAAAFPGKGAPILPFAELSEAAWGVGDISLAEDPDGTTRRYRLTRRYGGNSYAGFAPVIAERALGSEIRLEGTPMARDGTLWVNWYGGYQSFPYIDAHKVLKARAQSLQGGPEQNYHRRAMEMFKGKTVLIGVTAAGLFDLRVNPFASVYPGVEIHATVVSNLLNSHFIRPMDGKAAVFYVIGLSLLVGFWFSRLKSPLIEALAVSAILGAVFLAAFAAFRFCSLWVPVALPAICVFAIAAGHMIWHYFVEGRDKRHLRSVFSKYINEDVMRELLADPKNLELGGKNAELTILFSDIRGFTSLSENLRPDEVVSLLNEYLTAMVDIVFEYGGTLDKFIGDAVMAFWGAPVATGEHADQAVKAARAMIRKTAEIRAKWVQQGRPALKIGVGVNTGTVTVGNIGSSRSQSYTVIGDEVNLASRLESLNKELNTELIISESTHRQISSKGDLGLRDLGEVRVKGKEKAVRIYGN